MASLEGRSPLPVDKEQAAFSSHYVLKVGERRLIRERLTTDKRLSSADVAIGTRPAGCVQYCRHGIVRKLCAEYTRECVEIEKLKPIDTADCDLRVLITCFPGGRPFFNKASEQVVGDTVPHRFNSYTPHWSDIRVVRAVDVRWVVATIAIV